MKYEELTLEDLKRMQEVDVRTVNIEELTDLRDIQIDTKLPVEEKGPSIDDKMEEYLRHLAEIHI